MRSGWFVLVPVLMILGGCATQTAHYEPIEKNLKSDNYKKAAGQIKESKEEAYEKKDRVLYSLEAGLAQHYAGMFEDSNKRLSRANQYIDELYTKSISNMGFSFLTNNTELPYRGESYEDIYLNLFKALNYAHTGDVQGAGVEFRKMNQKLSKMETRYRRMASDYENSYMSGLENFDLSTFVDTLDYVPSTAIDSDSFQLLNTVEQLGDATIQASGDTVTIGDFQQGELRFHSSALGRYFGNAYYLNEREYDDARIERERYVEAFKTQGDIYNFDRPGIPDEPVRDSDKARVYTLAMLGQAPIKKQQRSPSVTIDKYNFDFVYPVLVKRDTIVDKVEIYKNNQRVATLHKVEDIGNVAEALFEVKFPLTLTQNAMRALVKEIALQEAQQQVQQQGGLWAGIAGMVAGEAVEVATKNADLRTTRLLPDEVHVGYFEVPANQSVSLKAKYFSNGEKISEENFKQTYKSNGLNILELKNFR